MFSSAQAAKALCVEPATMRSYRLRYDMGEEIFPMRTGWTMAELERLRRSDKQPKWKIRFSVHQLSGNPIKGQMIVWAPAETVARSKSSAWFWEAMLKEEPKKWGIPTKMEITTIDELAL